jgi:hypothetical protein
MPGPTRLKRLMTGAVVLFGTTSVAIGQDKSQYNLFNPTPEHLLRELTADRPDTTESPFTVDAGHVQVETTIVGFSRSPRDSAGVVTDTVEIATTNVRIGLTNTVEAGFIWQPYGIVRTRDDPMGSVRQSGIGGLELRGKVNLWGNDTFGKTGSSALGLLPFVVLPTDRRSGISPEFAEAGLIVPYALKLSEKFGLGLNAGVTWLKSDADTGHHAEYLTSASLAYEWSEKIGTYYEVAARFHTDDPRGDVVVLGTGLTYRLSKNVQFDAGVNFGVTPAADRFNPFVGLAVRF